MVAPLASSASPTAVRPLRGSPRAATNGFSRLAQGVGGLLRLLLLAGDPGHRSVAGAGRRRRHLGLPALTCRAFGGKLRPDQGFEVHTYPGVVHAFDNEETPDRVVKDGHPLQYDKPAAEDSYVRVKAFLDRYVAARKP